MYNKRFILTQNIKNNNQKKTQQNRIYFGESANVASTY